MLAAWKLSGGGRRLPSALLQRPQHLPHTSKEHHVDLCCWRRPRPGPQLPVQGAPPSPEGQLRSKQGRSLLALAATTVQGRTRRRTGEHFGGGAASAAYSPPTLAVPLCRLLQSIQPVNKGTVMMGVAAGGESGSGSEQLCYLKLRLLQLAITYVKERTVSGFAAASSALECLLDWSAASKLRSCELSPPSFCPTSHPSCFAYTAGASHLHWSCAHACCFHKCTLRLEITLPTARPRSHTHLRVLGAARARLPEDGPHASHHQQGEDAARRLGIALTL